MGMSDLTVTEALDNLDKHGVYTGVKESYAAVVDAALRWDAIGSEETREAVGLVIHVRHERRQCYESFGNAGCECLMKATEILDFLKGSRR
jgi:hypothetical protein